MFNFYTYMYGMFTNRPRRSAKCSNAAKVGFNGRVKALREAHGVATQDVKPLILFAFLHETDPISLARIDVVFTHYKSFVRWKLDYYYDIKAKGIMRALLDSKPETATPTEWDSEIAEAYSL